MQKKNDNQYLKKISQGTFLSIIIMFLLFFLNRNDLYNKFLIYETLPYVKLQKEMLFKFHQEPEKSKTVVQATEEVQDDIIGIHNVIFQDDTKEEEPVQEHKQEKINFKNIEKLSDFSYLIKNFYTVDSKTSVNQELINVDRFLNTDLKIDNSVSGPKVLIFHTHAHETYYDSNDESEGVLGVGARLKEELETVYGIEVYHYTNGLRDIGGSMNTAYEDIEPPVREILEKFPTIQVVIDLHRDGFDIKQGEPLKKFVSEIDGKQTAQIMFFNGLSILNKNGKPTQLTSLPNPNLDTNLAFSFNMQLAANELYPEFTRKIYLKSYRYSLHMKPKSLLIEVGANTNTKEEAFNTAKPLAKILASVIN